MKIDKNIIHIVKYMNNFPGIHTEISCGGHKPPLTCSQVNEGEFYVQYTANCKTSEKFIKHIYTYMYNNWDEKRFNRTKFECFYFDEIDEIRYIFKGYVEDWGWMYDKYF